jgi:hypothetical protein
MPEDFKPGQLVELTKQLFSVKAAMLYPAGFVCRVKAIHPGGQIADVELIDPETGEVLETPYLAVQHLRQIS